MRTSSALFGEPAFAIGDDGSATTFRQPIGLFCGRGHPRVSAVLTIRSGLSALPLQRRSCLTRSHCRGNRAAAPITLTWASDRECRPRAKAPRTHALTCRRTIPDMAWALTLAVVAAAASGVFAAAASAVAAFRTPGHAAYCAVSEGEPPSALICWTPNDG